MATYIESSGLISIEAENKASAIRRGATGWTQATTTASYSGAGYMVANQTNTASSGYATASDELRYSISVTTTGTWYVWLRVYTTSSSNNSVNIGLDGATPASGYQVQNTTHGSWQWMRSLQAGGNASLSITTAGTHTINVWARESGLLFDKIVLSTSSAYTPSGTGPAESSTTGGGGSYTKYVKQSLALWQRSDMAYVSYASNTANIRYYFEVLKTDGTTVYIAGPLAADGRTGTQYSSAATAQSNELTASDIGNMGAYVVRFPTMLEMQAITLWHRATSGSIPIAEFYSPIVVQADQVRALQLSAISANMGNLTVDGALTLGPLGTLYGGTGDATTPDTGIKLWLDSSSGVGVMRIMSYRAGVEQAGFNSQGQFIAGSGAVTLDAYGLRFTTTGNAPSLGNPFGDPTAAMTWRDGTTALAAYIAGYANKRLHLGVGEGNASSQLGIDPVTMQFGSGAPTFRVSVGLDAALTVPLDVTGGITASGPSGTIRASKGLSFGTSVSGGGATLDCDSTTTILGGDKMLRMSRDAQLASTANSRVNLMEWSAKTPAGNVVKLTTDLYRMSTGSDWATTGVIIQRTTDNTGQAWLMFGPNGFGMNVLNPQYLLHLAADSAAKPGSSTWTVTSDARTKRFLGTYDRGLDLITSMGRARRYRYNGKFGTPKDGTEYAGWSAQEVQQVAPELVKSHTWTHPLTGKTTDILTLDLGAGHTAAMHNAIIELSEQLDAERARNDALEARLAALEARLS